MIQLLQFVLGAKIEIKKTWFVLSKSGFVTFRVKIQPLSHLGLDFWITVFFFDFGVVINIFLQKTSAFFTISTNYLFIYYLRQVFEEKNT